MWKLIIILVLIIYLLNKISTIFFRMAGRNQPPRQEPRKPSEPRKGSIKGGEYVDYEEVK